LDFSIRCLTSRYRDRKLSVSLCVFRAPFTGSYVASFPLADGKARAHARGKLTRIERWNAADSLPHPRAAPALRRRSDHSVCTLDRIFPLPLTVVSANNAMSETYGVFIRTPLNAQALPHPLQRSVDPAGTTQRCDRSWTARGGPATDVRTSVLIPSHQACPPDAQIRQLLMADIHLFNNGDRFSWDLNCG
jgi:hypothetical protein